MSKPLPHCDSLVHKLTRPGRWPWPVLKCIEYHVWTCYSCAIVCFSNLSHWCRSSCIFLQVGCWTVTQKWNRDALAQIRVILWLGLICFDFSMFDISTAGSQAGIDVSDVKCRPSSALSCPYVSVVFGTISACPREGNGVLQQVCVFITFHNNRLINYNPHSSCAGT